MEVKPELVIYKHEVKAREAQWASLPSDLNPHVADMMKAAGKTRLYTHQLEAYKLISQGKGTCFVTGTGSGKTIGTMLAVINDIANHKEKRCLIIVPTRALASNMADNLGKLLDNLKGTKIRVGVYDGGTEDNVKRTILKSCQIIITNPEMVNVGLLPRHRENAAVSQLFDNLAYCFVDEIHEWVALTGSNIACLMARLIRVSSVHGSHPLFCCASATIGNPIELAEGLFHQDFTLIDNDGSPAASKNYWLLKPPVDKNGFSMPPQKLAVRISSRLLLEHKRHINFCSSRTSCEVMLRETQELVRRHPTASSLVAGRIQVYRGGYKPLQRKQIEKNFSSGKIVALIATSSLEVGVDIPNVDNLIQTGFPKSISSFHQRNGRAGRGTNPSNCYIILGNSPREKYIECNPQWLFNDASPEVAVIDPANRRIQTEHIRAAAYEAALIEDDKRFFPDLESIAEELIEAGELQKEGSSYRWCGFGFPASDVNIRNFDKIRYVLLDTSVGELVTESDQQQAHRELFPGAIYQQAGVQYAIEAFDEDNKVVYCHPVKVNYFSRAIILQGIVFEDKLLDKTTDTTTVCFGGVRVETATVAYKLLEFHNHQILQEKALDVPLVRYLHTHAVWFLLNSGLKADKKYACDGSNSGESIYDSLAYAIACGAALVTQADFTDIGYANVECEDGNTVAIVIYDRVSGGIGYSRAIYENIETVLETSIDFVSRCKCKNGCSECINATNLDKSLVLQCLRNLAGKGHVELAA